jgi:hypothetical protein
MTKRAARDPKDYAIEFAGYLANSAERFMAAVNAAHRSMDVEYEQSQEEADMELGEARLRLLSDIHEFRKRAARVE